MWSRMFEVQLLKSSFVENPIWPKAETTDVRAVLIHYERADSPSPKFIGA
jgi:hypothetical protein